MQPTHIVTFAIFAGLFHQLQCSPLSGASQMDCQLPDGSPVDISKALQTRTPDSVTNCIQCICKNKFIECNNNCRDSTPTRYISSRSASPVPAKVQPPFPSSSTPAPTRITAPSRLSPATNHFSSASSPRTTSTTTTTTTTTTPRPRSHFKVTLDPHPVYKITTPEPFEYAGDDEDEAKVAVTAADEDVVDTVTEDENIDVSGEEDVTTTETSTEFSTETAFTDKPTTETPATETPATETPTTEEPTTEAPTTKTPTIKTFSTRTPSTKTPSTRAPSAKTSSTPSTTHSAPKMTIDTQFEELKKKIKFFSHARETSEPNVEALYDNQGSWNQLLQGPNSIYNLVLILSLALIAISCSIITGSIIYCSIEIIRNRRRRAGDSESATSSSTPTNLNNSTRTLWNPVNFQFDV